MADYAASTANLVKTIRFLSIAAIAGCVLAASIVVFFPEQDEPKSIGEYLSFLVTPVILVGFIGAIIVLPIGAWSTIRFWIFQRSYYRSELSFVQYVFFPASVVLCRKKLSATGMEVRKELIAALRWVGVGVLLCLIVLFLAELPLVRNDT